MKEKERSKSVKVNDTILFWEAVVATKKEKVTGICDKTFAGNPDVGYSSRVGLNPVVNPQLVTDSAHMPAMGPKISAMTLIQVGDSLNHEGFFPGSRVEGDLNPEMPSEKMSEDNTLWFGLVMEMLRRTSDILPHCSICPGREA